jgi:Neocarzinostatin family
VDATGSVSGFVTVERMLQSLDGTGTVHCSAAPGACAIPAFDLASTVVDALITFGDPSVPQPALSVSPATDLADGDVVTVTGTRFPAGASVTVAQCVTNRPAATDWCDDQQPVTVSADAAGAFVVEFTVHRGITIPSGSVIDCAGDAALPAPSLPRRSRTGSSSRTSAPRPRVRRSSATGPHTWRLAHATLQTRHCHRLDLGRRGDGSAAG